MAGCSTRSPSTRPARSSCHCPRPPHRHCLRGSVTSWRHSSWALCCSWPLPSAGLLARATYKESFIWRFPISRAAPAREDLMRASFLFTSESVSEGHPYKVADQISDAVVDLFLSKDPYARIACETLTTTNRVVLAGEIRCKGVFENDEWAPGAKEEIEAAVRATVKRIGYEQDGFHWKNF